MSRILCNFRSEEIVQKSALKKSISKNYFSGDLRFFRKNGFLVLSFLGHNFEIFLQVAYQRKILHILIPIMSNFEEKSLLEVTLHFSNTKIQNMQGISWINKNLCHRILIPTKEIQERATTLIISVLYCLLEYLLLFWKLLWRWLGL